MLKEFVPMFEKEKWKIHFVMKKNEKFTKKNVMKVIRRYDSHDIH